MIGHALQFVTVIVENVVEPHGTVQRGTVLLFSSIDGVSLDDSGASREIAVEVLRLFVRPPCRVHPPVVDFCASLGVLVFRVPHMMREKMQIIANDWR